MSRIATIHSPLHAPTFTDPNGDPEPQRGSFLASRPGSFLASVEAAFTATVTPLADGSYFDRMYWSFIRFADGKLVYRNGSSEFVAPRTPP